MDLLSHLQKAREAQSTIAAKRRASQVFQLSWRGTGSEYVVGWQAVCAVLGMKESSLACRLSTHKNAYTVTRTNPVSGEPDILTISRVSAAKAANKLKGRPPKQVDVDRLGSEAPYARRAKWKDDLA